MKKTTNSGNWNSGNWNSGNWNSGNCNSGYRNSGNWNSGNWNSGNWNSGNCNSGNRNSGNCNSGNRNSGNWNSGDRNSGNWNSGNRNSGDWNSGNWNSGYFNTNTPDRVRIFDQWIEMSRDEFEDKYNIYADLPLNRWVYVKDMSEEEKGTVQGWSERGGYLKTLEFKEACKIWWVENPNRHDDFMGLPCFDAGKFKEITGIDVNQETEEMTMDEVCKVLGRTIKIEK